MTCRRGIKYGFSTLSTHAYQALDKPPVWTAEPWWNCIMATIDRVLTLNSYSIQ